MALVPVVVPADVALVELEDISSSAGSLGRILDSQKSLFHSQIEQLQKIVVLQCKLTGVNPLSQEMAAGAMSIKIGRRRPKDPLNPKVIKYMQSIFSIKDTIGKKETREISALCGITFTQVRDYFSGQRSRVRKLVNLSREKASSSETFRGVSDVCFSSTGQTLLERTEVSSNTVNLRIVGECAQVPENMENITAAYTQVTRYPGNAATQRLVNSGNAAKKPPMNSGNTVCTQVIGNSGNFAPVCTQVVQHSENAATVCTQVVQHSENAATVCTQVPGNFWIAPFLGTQVPGNLGSFGIITPQTSADVTTVCAHSGVVSVVQEGQQSQVKPNHKTAEGGPSSSLQEETIPGVDSDDKRFLENIFSLMRKEQTFSGQMKLMEWILHIHNSTVLNWFSTKGGIMILASWLSQAAIEEQTTVLLVLFKVFCHLPLHKALPAQMSAILQTVNRLRFYRTSDISNSARTLLSRWSNMFVRSQALRNPSRNPPKNAQEIIRKDRISEILCDESWQSKIDFPEEILALAGNTDDSRKPEEPKQALKLLEFSDGATKKHGRNVSSSKTKERRKILLVEHPDRKIAGRSMPVVARAAPSSNHSRPMSADDIQKAKMRAIFMQDKYGKPAEELKTLPRKIETPTNPKRNITSMEQCQIQWHTPAEIRMNPSWEARAGENSKEVEIQNQRNRREEETVYSNPKDIPSNPKEPWDIEMDFDDSLTPEIPTEQPTDLDSPASTVPANAKVVIIDTSDAAAAATTTTTSSNNGLPEPDLELLSVLLKNPDVVFALTSSQGKTLTNEEMVSLLDLVKTTGAGLAGLANGMASISTLMSSLPEQTAASNGTRVGCSSEFPPSHSQIPQPKPTVTANSRTPQRHQPHYSYAPPLSQNPNQETIMSHSNRYHPLNNPSYPVPNSHSHMLPETMTYQQNTLTGRGDNNNYNGSNNMYTNGWSEMGGSHAPEFYRNFPQPEWSRQANPWHRNEFRSGGGGERGQKRDRDRRW